MWGKEEKRRKKHCLVYESKNKEAFYFPIAHFSSSGGCSKDGMKYPRALMIVMTKCVRSET